MGRMCLAVVALTLLASATSCKKRRAYDLSSPEDTLVSFERALADNRIPRDSLGEFIGSAHELAAWKLRCRTRGCKRGTFEVVKRVSEADFTAVLLVDYRVEDADGAHVIRGKASPIRFTREQGRWLIEQFGTRVPSSTSPKPGAPGRDAGTAAGAPTEEP